MTTARSPTTRPTRVQCRAILPQLLETTDFLNFRALTLNGRAVQNKGMAFFPRRIDGRYAMLSRQDDENSS